MQRAAAPPHPARPAARAENVPPPRQEGDNVAPAGMICTFYPWDLRVHFFGITSDIAYVIYNIIWKSLLESLRGSLYFVILYSLIFFRLNLIFRILVLVLYGISIN